MTIWQEFLPTHRLPRYAAIADAIASAVGAGALSAGDRLPPQRELAQQLSCTVGTVSRGYALAESRGIIRAHVGRGTFVNTHPDIQTASLLPREDRGDVDLSVNMPIGASNAKALADTLLQIGRENDLKSLLRYMPTAGHIAHRTAAADWIKRSGYCPAPENILLTHGAQQSVSAIFDALVPPGGCVLTERYTYSGLIESARLKNVRLRGVAIDQDGIVPDALEEAVRETNSSLVFLIPTIHNPTASVMSIKRREAIAALADRLNLTVVEDDVYGYLLDRRPPPIASMIPERTVYITGASKCLAPGLRVGWLSAPQKLLGRFSQLIYAQSVAQSALNHEIVRRWIENGTADRLARELSQETAARHALAVGYLGKYEIESHCASFHLLLHLPESWNGDSFIAAARMRGVRVTSVAPFAVEPQHTMDAVRLSLVAAEDRSALHKGLAVIVDLLESGPGNNAAVI
jgi:DNA-binding transcriptional MocR family regulator